MYSVPHTQTLPSCTPSPGLNGAASAASALTHWCMLVPRPYPLPRPSPTSPIPPRSAPPSPLPDLLPPPPGPSPSPLPDLLPPFSPSAGTASQLPSPARQLLLVLLQSLGPYLAELATARMDRASEHHSQEQEQQQQQAVASCSSSSSAGHGARHAGAHGTTPARPRQVAAAVGWRVLWAQTGLRATGWRTELRSRLLRCWPKIRCGYRGGVVVCGSEGWVGNRGLHFFIGRSPPPRGRRP